MVRQTHNETPADPQHSADDLPLSGLPTGLFHKLNYTTNETIEIIGSPRMFQRLRFHGWLLPLIPHSRDALYPLRRILKVQDRLEAGDYPPLLPSEIESAHVRMAAKQRATISGSAKK